jgi:hypothetical protein
VSGTFSPPVGGATEAKQDDIIATLIDLENSVTAPQADEDSAHVSTHAGMFILGVRNDNDATRTDSDGDYSGLAVDSAGRVKLAASEAHLGEVGGNTTVVSAEFSRPADTTAYAAKDAVANSTSAPTVLTFTNLARVAAGSGYVTKARLMTTQSPNVTQFRVHLYHTAPTAINDNAQWTLLWANRANRIGFIDFNSMQTEGSGSDAANAINGTVRLAFKCASASRNIFGLLETLGAFTPASAQSFFVELTAENN